MYFFRKGFYKEFRAFGAGPGAFFAGLCSGYIKVFEGIVTCIGQ
jgi:hypothetical protein